MYSLDGRGVTGSVYKDDTVSKVYSDGMPGVITLTTYLLHYCAFLLVLRGFFPAAMGVMPCPQKKTDPRTG